jgi:hypothetical protein
MDTTDSLPFHLTTDGSNSIVRASRGAQAVGAVLLQFGLVWPLVVASVVFGVAMIPLLFGDHQSK